MPPHHAEPEVFSLLVPLPSIGFGSRCLAWRLAYLAHDDRCSFGGPKARCNLQAVNPTWNLMVSVPQPGPAAVMSASAPARWPLSVPLPRGQQSRVRRGRPPSSGCVAVFQKSADDPMKHDSKDQAANAAAARAPHQPPPGPPGFLLVAREKWTGPLKRPSIGHGPSHRSVQPK